MTDRSRWHLDRGALTGPKAVLAGLAVLLLCGGCASTPNDEERERTHRRAQSHLEIGTDHLANGRPERALQELLLAERLEPKNPQIQYRLAQAYIYKGRLADVEQHLKRALQIHPELHDARLDLATLYIQQQRYEESLEQLTVLTDDPTFPAPWRAMSKQGWAQLKLGRNADARASLERAREFAPRYWPTLLNLGILESQEGHHLEAVELFQRMLELEPDADATAEANYRLAELYVSLGKRERAVGHLMAAVAQTPNGEWGRKSEEYLKLLR